MRAISLPLASFFAVVLFLGSASGQDGSLPRLELLRELAGRGSAFQGVWSSDGNKIAAYGSTDPHSGPFGNLVTVWTADGQKIGELNRPGIDWYSSLSSLGFVNGDRQVVAPSPPSLPGDVLSVFDIESGRVVHNVPGLRPDDAWNVNSAAGFAVSPDGKLIAVAAGLALPQPVLLYSTETWKPVAVVPDAPTDAAETTDHLAFSADGTLLAFNRGGHQVWIYDRASQRIIQKITPFPDFNVAVVNWFSFSPDASAIAIASMEPKGLRLKAGEKPGGDLEWIAIDDPLRVFRVSDGSQITSFRDLKTPIYRLAWSGHIIAFGESRSVSVWDPGRPVEKRTSVLRDIPLSLAFSPDGGRLATTDGPVTIFAIKP